MTRTTHSLRKDSKDAGPEKVKKRTEKRRRRGEDPAADFSRSGNGKMTKTKKETLLMSNMADPESERDSSVILAKDDEDYMMEAMEKP